MKIIFYKPHHLAYGYIKDWEEKNNVEVDIINEFLSADNVDKANGYDGLAMSALKKLDKSVYDKLKDMGIRQIALTSVGYEQIDLEYAASLGIAISNVPDYSPESIAEFTLMMILKALKKDKNIRENLEKNDYKQRENILGQTLRSKTLGIYGLGRIGALLAKYAHAMGARVISYSPRGKKDIEGVDFVASYDELLESSDIISIHSALSDENYHFFNKESFDKMKDGSMIFNCARGGLIDTKDLLYAIDSNKLSYAGLDVYENERVVNGKVDPVYEDEIFDRLMAHPKIDYYPHISYFTKTSMENQVKFALDSALDIIKTGTSKNKVN